MPGIPRESIKQLSSCSCFRKPLTRTEITHVNPITAVNPVGFSVQSDSCNGMPMESKNGIISTREQVPITSTIALAGERARLAQFGVSHLGGIVAQATITERNQSLIIVNISFTTNGWPYQFRLLDRNVDYYYGSRHTLTPFRFPSRRTRPRPSFDRSA